MKNPKLFAFWEGQMPAYIQLCMETWRLPVTMLNYDNLHNYTDLKVDSNLKRFTLPIISDAVRAHVLRDQGGYWLDTDTVMLADSLGEYTIKGYPDTRDHTWGYLFAEMPGMEFYTKWAEYQDKVIANPNTVVNWPVLCRDFTDPYLKNENLDISIAPIQHSWPETYLIPGDAPRYEKYRKLYFESAFTMKSFRPTDILMLHNSGTPKWYKDLSAKEVLASRYTLSNVLRAVLEPERE